MTKLTPFADDAASVSIETLTIENGTTRLALYGSLEITRDKAGLRRAQALKAILDQAVQVLSADPGLPEHQAPVDKPKTVRNPFA
jgi:hypothetical protein